MIGVGIDDMSRLENGYGVRNVIERIKLNYGEKYGVTFESSPRQWNEGNDCGSGKIRDREMQIQGGFSCIA